MITETVAVPHGSKTRTHDFKTGVGLLDDGRIILEIEAFPAHGAGSGRGKLNGLE